MKRVLDVGNCGPDHAAIRGLIEHHFQARVDQVDRAEDALVALKSQEYALVLVNRKLDCDDSDGSEVIRQVKAQPELSDVPVMMITNFPEHQRAAVEIGAVEGFGKNSLAESATVDLLRRYLT